MLFLNQIVTKCKIINKNKRNVLSKKNKSVIMKIDEWEEDNEK